MWMDHFYFSLSLYPSALLIFLSLCSLVPPTPFFPPPFNLVYHRLFLPSLTPFISRPMAYSPRLHQPCHILLFSGLNMLLRNNEWYCTCSGVLFVWTSCFQRVFVFKNVLILYCISHTLCGACSPVIRLHKSVIKTDFQGETESPMLT